MEFSTVNDFKYVYKFSIKPFLLFWKLSTLWWHTTVRLCVTTTVLGIHRHTREKIVEFCIIICNFLCLSVYREINLKYSKYCKFQPLVLAILWYLHSSVLLSTMASPKPKFNVSTQLLVCQYPHNSATLLTAYEKITEPIEQQTASSHTHHRNGMMHLITMFNVHQRLQSFHH